MERVESGKMIRTALWSRKAISVWFRRGHKGMVTFRFFMFDTTSDPTVPPIL